MQLHVIMNMCTCSKQLHIGFDFDTTYRFIEISITSGLRLLSDGEIKNREVIIMSKDVIACFL